MTVHWRLYRVIYIGGEADYNADGSLTAWSQVHLRSVSDRDFKKSIQLQVNGDDDPANRRLHNMFMTFSSRDAAVKWAQNLQKNGTPRLMAIAHINGPKLGDMSSRWVYHAAYVVKELRIPLRQGEQISDLYHQYFVLHRIPSKAILEIENITPQIPLDIQRRWGH